jgi:hypothetical protein
LHFALVSRFSFLVLVLVLVVVLLLLLESGRGTQNSKTRRRTIKEWKPLSH